MHLFSDQVFGQQAYYHLEPDPQEDPESTIRPAQLETMLQGGTGDFESTWTQSELTEQMRMGSSSVGRDIYDQQDDNTDLFDDLELISDAAGCQTLTVMEQDMIMQHSVPQQRKLNIQISISTKTSTVTYYRNIYQNLHLRGGGVLKNVRRHALRQQLCDFMPAGFTRSSRF